MKSGVRPPHRLLAVLALLISLLPAVALGQSQDGELRHGYRLFSSSPLEAGRTLITLYPGSPERVNELIEVAYVAYVRFLENGTNITSASGTHTNANSRMLAIVTNPSGVSIRHFLNRQGNVAECGRFRAGGSGNYSGSPGDVLTEGDTQETLDISCMFPRRGGSANADVGSGLWMDLTMYNNSGIGGSVTFHGEGHESHYRFTVNGMTHDESSFPANGTRATVVLGPPRDAVQNTVVSLRIEPARTDGRYFSDESVSANLDFSFDYRYRLWGRATRFGVRPDAPTMFGISVTGASSMAFDGGCEDSPADVPSPSGNTVLTISTGCSVGPLDLPIRTGEIEVTSTGGGYVPLVQGMDQRGRRNLPSGLKATLTVVDDTEPVFGEVTGATVLALGEEADWTPPSVTGGNPPLATTYVTTGAVAGLVLDPASGRITGTPTEGGLFSYRAVVTDSDSQIDGRDNDSVTLDLDFRVEDASDATAPTVTALSPTELSVTWVAPATEFAITGHDVEYWSGFGATQTVTVSGTGTSVVISALEIGTPYTVRVRATGDSQESAWSTAAGGRTGVRWMLSMADTSAGAAEAGTADVTVTVAGAPGSDLRLEFELGSDSDPATRDADTGADADLGTVPADVTLSAGATEAVLSIPIRDDTLSEPPEVLVVTLTGASVAGPDPSPDRALLGSPVTTAVTIGASDPIRFSVTGPAELREDDASASEYMVTLTGGGIDSDLDVTIETDGSADVGTDYVLSTTTLSFGQDDLVEAFSIDPTNPSPRDPEETETVVIGLSVPEGIVHVDPAAQDLTLTFHDDDVGTVYFGPAGGGTYDTGIMEGGDPLVIPVQYRGLDFSGTVTVPVARSGDSEAGTAEYAIEPLRIVNAAAETSMTVYARYDGKEFEGDEDLILDFDLLPPVQSSLVTLLTGDPDDPRVRARLTIRNNSTQPSTVVALSSDPGILPEAGDATGVVVTAFLAGGTRPPNDVTVTLSLSGDAATEASPFPELTIGAGRFAGSATVSIAPVDDSDATGNRAVEVRGSGRIDRNDGQALEDLSVSAVSVAIADDDSTGLAISGPTGMLEESVGDVVFTLTLAEQVGVELTVTLAVDGTADEGSDFTAPAEGGAEVVFPADAIPGAIRMVTVSVADDPVNEPSETIVMSISGMSPDLSGMLSVETATARVTIAPSDPLFLILTGPDYSVPSGSRVPYGLALRDENSRPAASSVPVTGVITPSATDPGGVIHNYAPRITVTVPAGDSTVTFLGTRDVIAAGGTYTMRLYSFHSQGSGTIYRSSQLAHSRVRVTVRDSVRANFVTADHSVSEAGVGTPAEIAVTLDSEHIMPVDVPIAVSSSSSATEGDDFVLSASTLTFDTGVTRQTFSVSALDDSIDEGDGEELVLGFGDLPGGIVAGTTASETVTIADDDTASTSVTLSASTVTVSEASAESVVAVGVTASLAGEVTRSPDLVLPLAIGGEPESVAAATSGDDYSFGADPLPELTIPAGMPAGSVTLMLTLVDDEIVEPDEAVVLTSAVGGFDITAVEVTITDGDTSSVSVGGPASPVAEDAGSAGFTVTLQRDVAADVTVTLGTVDGTAVAGEDYTALAGAAATVVFPASSGAGATRPLPVAVTDDGLFEGDEGLGVTISGLTSDLGGRITPSPDAASAVIAASDPVAVSLEAPETIAESAGEVGITLHFSGGELSGETTVDLDYDGDATRGADYTGEDRFTFTGDLSEYSGISLAIIDDIDDDEDEAITVGFALSGGGGGTFGYDPDPPSLTVGIVDDDEPRPSDRIGLSLQTLSVTVPDSLDDPVVFTPAGAIATVHETPAPPSGGGPDPVPFLGLTASLEGSVALADDLAVTVTLGGTAGELDYTFFYDGTSFDRASMHFTDYGDNIIDSGETLEVTIPAGSLTGTVVAELLVGEEETNERLPISEPTETLVLSGSAAGFTVTNEVTLTIADRIAGHAALTASEFAGTEGGEVLLQVELEHQSAVRVTLPWTATPADDLEAGSGSVTFDAYETPETAAMTVATITLALAEDSLLEATETIDIALGMPTTDPPLFRPYTLTQSAVDGVYSAAEVAVTDNDTASVSVVAPSGEVAEPGEAIFGVSLSAAPGTGITVTLTTSDGTAMADEDYTARSGAGSTVTFAAGDAAGSTRPFTVGVLDDGFSEPGEAFSVGVAGVFPDFGARLTLPDTPTPATIGANDPLTAALSGPAAAAEGDSATYTVEVTGGESTEPVVVGIGVSSDSAEAGDYTAPPAELTLQAAVAVTTFAIPFTGDGAPETGEVLTVSLTSAAGGGGGTSVDDANGRVDTSIHDNIEAGFVPGTHGVDEADTGTPATVAVTLSPAPGREVRIPVVPSSSSGATEGEDYTVSPAVLVFGAGQTRGDVVVTAVDDNLDDDNEVITLSFGALPEGVVAGTPDTAEVTIADDDASPSGTVSLSMPTLTATVPDSLDEPVVFTPGSPAATVTEVGSDIDDGDFTLFGLVASLEGATALPDDLVVTVELGGTAADFDYWVLLDGEFDRDLSVFVNQTTRIEFGETLEVTIPAGSLEGTLFLELWAFEDETNDNDPIAEPAETMVLTGSAAGHTVSNELTLTIVDGVAGHAALTGDEFAGAEGEQVTLTVELAHPSVLPVTLSWTATPAGVLDADTGSVVFSAFVYPEAASNTVATITLDLAQDSLLEADGTVDISLSAPSTEPALFMPFTLAQSADDGTYSVAAVAVADDETAEISVVAPSGDVAEPGEAAFGLSLSAAPGTDITVTLTTSDGTAAAGEDYTARSGAGSTVTFATGDAAGTTRPFTVVVLEDNLSEPAETFSVGVAGVSPDFGARLTLPDTPVPATIGASDPLTVALSGPAGAAEGGPATYTVDVTGGESTAPVTVGIGVSSDSAGAADYIAPPAELELPTGTSMTTFAVPLTEDDMPDMGEVLTVSITSATGGGGTITLDSLASAVTTTIEETLAGRVSVSPVALAEGATATLALSLSSAPATAVTASYDISGSSGVEASDYSDLGSGQISVAAGATSGAAMVEINDDALGEIAETLTVTFRGIGFIGASDFVAAFAGPTVAEVTIAASDAAAVSISGPANIDLREGSARTYRVEVAGNLPPEALTVTFSVGGTADPGADYESLAPGGSRNPVTIAAGSTVAQVRVVALEDAARDPDETVVLGLAGASGVTGPVALSPGTVEVRIVETNSPATFGADSGALLRRSVSESAVASDPVGAPLAATDPDETDAPQYLMVDDAGGRFGIDPGSGQVTVADPSDFDHESGVTVHTVTVGVTDGLDGFGRPDPAADDEVAVAITLTDAVETLAPPPGVAVSAAAEGGHRALAVSWEEPSAAGVPPATGYELGWRLAGSGAGYTVVPGPSAPVLSATLIGLEPATRYELRMRAINEDGRGEWSAPATGETAPGLLVSVSRAAIEVTEGGGMVTVTVVLSEASSADLTVTYSVAGADAEDYSDPGGGMLVFPAGATIGLITLSVADDEEGEPAETVTVSLSSVSAPGASVPVELGTELETAMTIVASDAVVVALAGPRTFDVAEGDSLSLAVSLSGADPPGDVTVGIGVTSPGASDLSSPLPVSVTLVPESHLTPVPLRALIDGVEDAGETVVVSVAEVIGAVTGVGFRPYLADPSPVTATIIEPNSPPVFAGPPPEVGRTRKVRENAAAGTAVGGALPASDADGDALAYSLEDASPGFPFALSGAQLTVVSPPDHEASATHRAVVAVSDGKDARGLADPSVDARVTVEVTVADVAEPPPAPEAPSVSPASTGGHAALVMFWSGPDVAGRPPVSGYDVRYRRVGDMVFADAGHTGVATSLTLPDLAPGAAYEVRVRARNADGAGVWSLPGIGRTEAGVGVLMAALSASGAEGATATVTVRTTSAPGRPLLVGYGLRNAGAAESDYRNPLAGTLTIAAGSRAGHVVFPLVDDFAGEGDEVFAVSLTSAMPAGGPPGRVAVLSPSETSVTILASDALALSLSAPETVAAGGIATATVSVGGGPWPSPVTVGIGAGGSAAPGDRSVPSSVVVAASQPTAPVPVTVSSTAAGGDEIELWVSYRSGAPAGVQVVRGETVATITVGTPNTPASFDAAGVTLEVPEDLGAGGVVGAVPASDPDEEDSTLVYRLASGAGGRFSIDAGGTLRLAATATLDFEASASHTLEAEVRDGRSAVGAPDSAADDQARVVVRVRDVDEPPLAPGQPSAAPHSGDGHRRLDISWSAPEASARPPASGYHVEIKEDSEPAGSYRRVAHSGTGTSAVAGGLPPGTAHNVRVRAFSPEGIGTWSPAATASTDSGVVVSMAEQSLPVDEGSTSTVATVRVELAPAVPAASEATVTYSVRDAGARANLDYVRPPDGSAVTVASGASSADILMTVLYDNFIETDEAFVVRLEGVSGAGGLAVLGTQAETTVTIRKNNAVVLGITAPSTLVAGATVQATVSATGDSHSSDSLLTGVAGGDSVEGVDHVAPVFPQVLQAGASPVLFDVVALDTARAGRELHLTIGADHPDLVGPRVAILTIVRPNSDPDFAGVATEVSAGEDSAPGSAIGVTFPADPDTGDTPSFTLSDPALFRVGADRALSLAAGATLDHESAAAHTLTVAVSDGKGAGGLPDRSVDARHTLTVAVTDVDEPPGQPGTPAVTGISDSELAVTWPEPGNAGPPITRYDIQFKPAGSPDSEYADAPRDAVSGMAAVIAGLAVGSEHDVRVRARNQEGEGPWSEPGTGATDLGALILSAATSPSALSEDDGAVQVTLTAEIAGSAAPDTALEFSVSVRADGSTAAHTDLGMVGLTIGAGSLSVTGVVDVELTDNDTVEAGRRLVFDGAPAGHMVIPVTVAVADDDTAGVTVVWDSAGTHAAEGEGAELVFALDAPVDADVGLPWGVGLAGALDAGDIAAPLSGTVEFGVAGASAAASLTVTLDIEDDGLFEDEETVSVTLGPLELSDTGLAADVTLENTGPVVFPITANGTSTVNILGTEVEYALAGGATTSYVDVVEGETATLTLSLAGGIGTEDISVPVGVGAAGEGHSAQDADFTAPTTPVTVPAGSATVTFEVATQADSDDDAGEIVAITIGAPSGGAPNQDAARGSPAHAQVTIIESNGAPEFADTAISVTLEENTASVTMVSATDPDGHAVTYRIFDDPADSDTDPELFAIDAASGEISVAAGVRLDESRPGLTVTVEALDGRDVRDIADAAADTSLVLEVSVTDVDEPPPMLSTVTAAAPPIAMGGHTRVTVSWAPPGDDYTGPPITGYDIQVRPRGGTDDEYASFAYDGIATTVTVTGLMPETAYLIRVRARNDEDGGGIDQWTVLDAAGVTTRANTAPDYTAPSAAREVPENTAAGGAVGAPLPPDANDADALTYTLTGDRADVFGVNPADGQVTVAMADALDFEALEAGAGTVFPLTLEAEDEFGETDTIRLDITVTDTDEPPGEPANLSVDATTSSTRLTLAWDAPDNTGPPLLRYEVRHRETVEPPGSPGDFTVSTVAAGETAATIDTLDADTGYDVGVRATNDEGDGGWAQVQVRTGSAPSFRVPLANGDPGAAFGHADALVLFYSLRFGGFLRANPRLLTLVYNRLFPDQTRDEAAWTDVVLALEELDDPGVVPVGHPANVYSKDGSGLDHVDALMIFYSIRFGNFLLANPRLLNLVFNRLAAVDLTDEELADLVRAAEDLANTL